MTHSTPLDDPLARPDADGTAHLTYFDKSTQLGFTYNGYFGVHQALTGRIGITFNRYGEPIAASIKAPVGMWDATRSMTEALAHFQDWCHEYVVAFTRCQHVALCPSVQHHAILVAHEFNSTH